MALIDGVFREALEEEGLGFDNEVEAIRIAHEMDFFTLAFVCSKEQAEAMIDAGADVICAHLGLTPGGAMGPKKAQSIEKAKLLADEVFSACLEKAPDRIRMVYAGPIKSPMDLQYFYENTSAQGFIGGSSFERIPSERAIISSTRAFKYPMDSALDEKREAAMEGMESSRNYIEFVQQHIRQSYEQPITLQALSTVLHVSTPYLSTLFKKKMGISFTEYLIRFRLNKACELLEVSELPIQEVALRVVYPDSVQFSKIFKKYKGMAPRNYKTMLRSKQHAGVTQKQP